MTNIVYNNFLVEESALRPSSSNTTFIEASQLLTLLLCSQLANYSEQIHAKAGLGAKNSNNPTNPENDPGFDTGIPYWTDGQGRVHIDFAALIQKLGSILNFLRCNLMNIFAATEALTLFMNIGKVWSQLSPDQQGLLKKILGQPIQGGSITVFGGFTISDLGSLIAYAAVFAAFYQHGSEQDAKNTITNLLAQLAQVNPDLLNNCPTLLHFRDVLLSLQQDNYAKLHEWVKKHTDANGNTLDDNGNICTYAQWILDAQGYLGKFLNGTSFGTYQKEGSWEKNFYKTLLDNYWSEFKNCHDPMVLLAALFSIIEMQNDDRQDEIAGAAQPGNYLSIVGQINAEVLNLFITKNFSADNAKDFVGFLEEIKRYVNNDSDIPADLKNAINSNLNTFLNRTINGVTVEQLWKDGINGKNPNAFSQIAADFNKNVFGQGNNSNPPDPGPEDLFRQMTGALSSITDQCKEQSSISGTLVNSMTNVSNQFYAILKNLYDGYVNLEQAYVKNELIR